MNIIQFEELTNKLVKHGNELVLLDKDVAELFGVETRVLNQAITRNEQKFPPGYMERLSAEEVNTMVSQNVIPSKQKLGGKLPRVFTEKGLYMVATVLKSPKATEATFAIIETFAKIREVSRNINAIDTIKTEGERKSIVKRASEILEDIIDVHPVVEETDDEIIETEIRIELNLGFVKASKSTKKKKK